MPGAPQSATVTKLFACLRLMHAGVLSADAHKCEDTGVVLTAGPREAKHEYNEISTVCMTRAKQWYTNAMVPCVAIYCNISATLMESTRLVATC